MKKFWEISTRRLGVWLIGWLIATDLLVGLTHRNGWWFFKLLVFVCIIFLPGVALLRLLGIVFKSLTVGVVYSFGLGVLVLMLSGLVTNQILHSLGVDRPLELAGIFGIWNIIVGSIIVAGMLLRRRGVRIKKWSFAKVSKHSVVLTLLSLGAPCLATLGAFRLNNGGDGLLAQWAIFYIAALVVYVFLVRRRLSDGVIAWLIFSIGLAILLMTSMRGWDIVGHDIEREVRVYTLTHLHGYWDIALDRDPYNACLSITILPEMFTRLLDVPSLFVFKVILQIIFAVCPVVVYMLLREYGPKLAALTGTMLFICYPTFINDSAMLTRQGVAYLFFALALLLMANKVQTKRHKALFLLCALGAIWSHYSTSYMFVALFAVAVICKLLIRWWYARRKKPMNFATRHTVLSLPFVLLLFAMTFMWYTQITETSSGLGITLRESLSNIPKLFSSDNKSSDTSASLFFAGRRSQVDLYEDYLTDSQQKHAGEINASQYMPTLASDDLPITPLGEKAQSIGIDPFVITTLRQHFAKVLQVLALVGVVFVAVRLVKRKSDTLGPDFVCLSFAGIALLALLVILPVLSINYGLLRAFQQALIFLLLPMTLLLGWLGAHSWRWLRTPAATGGSVLLLLLFTGWFTQLLGGTSPSMTMNNRGLYYGLYYSSAADAQSFMWLNEHLDKKSDVRAANFTRAHMHDHAYPFNRNGILPSQTGMGTYTYLDPAQVVAQRMYTYYDSSPLVIEFPLDYYNVAKNQIYSTSTTRVYR